MKYSIFDLKRYLVKEGERMSMSPELAQEFNLVLHLIENFERENKEEVINVRMDFKASPRDLNHSKKYVDPIVKAIRKANYVYICGNGGSASTANHFANDLVKMCGVKAISLCANEAIVMAYANDNGYSHIFYDQLGVFWKDGDLLITISGSGTSKNILNAQLMTENFIAFPTMKEENMDMQRIEDYHLRLVHEITDLLSI